MSITSEKIQKVLARSGIGSRRQVEEWIKEGRIKVNNRVAKIGDRIDHTAFIEFDGRAIQLVDSDTETEVLMYHKPVGEICTRSDPGGRKTVFAKLPKIYHGRWINIGRLDINTSGLLLFTNNGELANQLMHPSHQVQREYMVRVLGNVDREMLKRLTHGVKLEDGMARFEEIIEGGGRGANRWFYVVVTEGRNRLVRRLWESQDVKISRLVRVRFGPIALPDTLRKGAYEKLRPDQIKQLETL